MRRIVSGLAMAIAAFAASTGPALACGTCGCSVNMSEVGTMDAAATANRSPARFMFQQDVAYRTINGSFNDQGTLRDIPTGSSLQSLQTTFGMTYYANPDWLVELLVPLVGNAFSGATPGQFGSVNLKDGSSKAGNLGDMNLQTAYRLFTPSGGWPSVGVWVGAIAPTGVAGGSDAQITGAGIWNGQMGLTSSGLAGDWSYEGSLGYQRPFGTPTAQATNFYVGDAMIYQGIASYALNPSWKLGMVLNGYLGQARPSAASSVAMSNYKLIPCVTYTFSDTASVRLGVGFTPGYIARSAMSDLSAYCTFYQYMR